MRNILSSVLMNVYHVTNDLCEASGVGTFVRGLDAALRAQGVVSRIATCPGDISAMSRSLRADDIVHIHGLWLALHRAAAKTARMAGAKIVWSTHGMTAPWAMRFKWWKKLPAWWLYQRRLLKAADAVHATTDQEKTWNERLGITPSKISVIPLGTDIIRYASAAGVAKENRTLLFVGRIHRVKAIDRIIEAFGLVPASVRSGWRLRIVGPDETGWKKELEALAAGLPVDFVGPKFGADLHGEYAGCDCLVLASHTENFGATVVDAMSCGKPVVTGRATPWKEVSDIGCGWWIDNTPASLAQAFSEMMSMSDSARSAMGEKGRMLVAEKYTWDAVGRRMMKVYGGLEERP